MSFFLLKTILASVFLAVAVSAVISMLALMGKTEKKINPKTLRNTHKIAGRFFLLLLLLLLFLGLRHWAMIGDQASIRAVFHAVLALGLTIIFLLKVAIVKFYKQFLRFAPVMGLLVFSFAFIVFSISAGFYSLRSIGTEPTVSEEIGKVLSEIVGDTDKGASYYQTNCLSCHSSDSEDKKVGPGLKDLFKKEILPHTGRPTTVKNIKQQLMRPALVMPSFTKLTEQEMADLIAYLKTL